MNRRPGHAKRSAVILPIPADAPVIRIVKGWGSWAMQNSVVSNWWGLGETAGVVTQETVLREQRSP
jgi:hypothetical protein